VEADVSFILRFVNNLINAIDKCFCKTKMLFYCD